MTDNKTAEDAFHNGTSSSKRLQGLVERLRRVEMETGMTLYVVHVAGTRMIEQGTDGLSRGSFLEGVMAGKDMLSYVDIARTAVERSPGLVEVVRRWTSIPSLDPLAVEGWFWDAHGIVGGERDGRGVWIPHHAPGGQVYLWSPPPVLADVALEEALKARHKRQDATHIFLIPELYTPQWTRLFYKMCDLTFRIPAKTVRWPSSMHESLCVGITFPYLSHIPWTIRRTPFLVEVERKLRRLWANSEEDAGDCVRELLRTTRRLPTMPQPVASQVLAMSRKGSI